jgi:hypothetical protein
MTDDLVDRLSRDLGPRPLRRVGTRLALALAAGVALTLTGVTLLLGLRPDMATASDAPMFWMKLAYPLGIAAIGLACMERLARPGASARRRARWLAAPLVVMALAALVQLAGAPHGQQRDLVMGGSAMACPWLIATCAIPPFAALIWAVRGLAPTRLRTAGAVAGLVAGSLAAGLYALHCQEPGGAFVMVWYSLGILAPAAAGAILGGWLLRWR